MINRSFKNRLLCALLMVVFLVSYGCTTTDLVTPPSSEQNSAVQNGVILGKDGYLFPASDDHYQYWEDYTGQTVYDQTHISNLALSLGKRKEAFQNNGCQYAVVFIPNSMSVYTDMFPEGTSASNEKTELTALCEYLAQNTEISFVNLTDVLTQASTKQNLFYKTDNRMNVLGAYYSFVGLMDHLQNDLVPSENNNYSIYKNFIKSIEGTAQTLAIQLNAVTEYSETEYQLSLSDRQIKYQETEWNELPKTVLSIPSPSSSSILLECSSEDTLSLFKNYFSNTFGEVIYKNNYTFSPEFLTASLGNTVIQLIHENELFMLTDADVYHSYEQGLYVIDEKVTMKPILLGVSMTSPTNAIIAGTVEENAILTVSGETFESFTVTPRNNRFFVTVDLGTAESDIITFSAKVENKEVSESVSISVSKTNEVEEDNSYVFVGENSQLHFIDTIPNYYGENLWDETGAEHIRNVNIAKIERIREATQRDTEYIYLIAPNCVTLYPETATPQMIEDGMTDYTLLDQFMEIADTIDGITVVDLRDILTANKTDSDYLYFQTDTHWNQLGSYYGYVGLMNYIAKSYPQAAPCDLSQFIVEKVSLDGGDLIRFLNMKEKIVTEIAYEISRNYTPKEAEILEYAENLTITLNKNAEELPTAYVRSDSYGYCMDTFLTDHFQMYARQPVGDHSMNYDFLAEYKPDYVIHVIVERNIAWLCAF